MHQIKKWVSFMANRHLLLTNTISSASIIGLADVAQQYINGDTEPNGWDWKRTMRMSAVGLVFGPVLHTFYRILDSRKFTGSANKVIFKKLCFDNAFTPFCSCSFMILDSIMFGEYAPVFMWIYILLEVLLIPANIAILFFSFRQSCLHLNIRIFTSCIALASFGHDLRVCNFIAHYFFDIWNPFLDSLFLKMFNALFYIFTFNALIIERIYATIYFKSYGSHSGRCLCSLVGFGILLISTGWTFLIFFLGSYRDWFSAIYMVCAVFGLVTVVLLRKYNRSLRLSSRDFTLNAKFQIEENIFITSILIPVATNELLGRVVHSLINTYLSTIDFSVENKLWNWIELVHQEVRIVFCVGILPILIPYVRRRLVKRNNTVDRAETENYFLQLREAWK